MRSDEAYRFLVLRDPATRAGTTDERDGSDARIVPTHAGEDYSESPFAQLIQGLLAEGGVDAARTASQTFLDQNVAAQLPDWRASLAAGTSLALALKQHAIADSEERAVEALKDLGTLRFLDNGGEQDASGPMSAWRNQVADLLVAATLTADPRINRTDACASICAAEAAHRLWARDADPKPAPWQPAVIDGLVVLPFELHPALDPTAAALNKYRFVFASMTAPLGPADLVSEKAVRTYIGDLIVLHQQLRRYELGEIAHIENVLLTEEFKRVHRGLKRVELTITEERETETINERDLQSTERDELRSELAKLVREEIHFGAQISATVSGKTPNGEYAVGGGASFGFDRANEERKKSAHEHAKEVVDRAREQITERTRASRSTITTTEDEDSTTHGFDNTEGEDHVVGVYRWVEKHYDLHLINYGRRLFYEIMIPEPSAYWRAVSARRTLVAAGPLPEWPSLSGVGEDADPERLGPGHLTLRDAAGAQDFPGRWNELVELAGRWGVELEPPPPAVTQLNFEISVPPKTEDKSGDPVHAHGGQGNFYYEDPIVKGKTLERAPIVPDGFEAVSGEVAFAGWNTVAAGGASNMGPGGAFGFWSEYERGTAWLQVGGRQEQFTVGVVSGDGPITRGMAAIFPDAAHALTGELAVTLSTNLNGAFCSCKLKCVRTAAAETLWISTTLDVFATAFAQRLADHTNAAKQSELDQRERDFRRTDATYRAIERRELKRQIIDLLMRDALELLGDTVVSATETGDSGPVQAGSVNTAWLAYYTRVVNFFEQAFDWTNLVYTFAPYFFGRIDDWEAAALVEESDPQFTAFLGAGAARVQLPVQLGYEPFVQMFFAGMGSPDPAQSVPWLATGRPIALDLAAAAREGFDLATGRVSTAADSATVTVSGAMYSASDDTGRELRINGHIFKIVEVRSPNELVLDRPVSDQAVDRAEYERGGLAVGPSIALKLPSTLVAIDKPDLQLPEFAGRYD